MDQAEQKAAHPLCNSMQQTAQPDSGSAPFRAAGHFSALGYSALAAEVAMALEKARREKRHTFQMGVGMDT